MRPDAGRPATVAIVAMAGSVHTARWVSMIRGDWARIVVIPVFRRNDQDVLAADRTIGSADDLDALRAGEVGLFDTQSVDWDFAHAVDHIAGFAREPHPAFPPGTPLVSAHHVTTAVRLIDPDLVHSMEVQVAGYLTLEAQRRMGAAFPPWLLSNWGSDIFLFRKLPDHLPVLKQVAGAIDGYWSECRRDIGIVRDLGIGDAGQPV